MSDPVHYTRAFDRRSVVLGTFIVLLPLAVYARTATFPFIVYDDPGYVYENAHVRAGLTWDNVVWAFTAGERSNWHPLTWLSHMLDADIYGMNAGGHHITNAILHAINALLVFLWLRRATTQTYPSAFAGLVFGLHPLHVESVAWISERKDVLCAFFFLSALILYTQYARKPRASSYAATTLCFALALLSKPMAVTWPFVALLTDTWPLQRIQRKNAVRCIAEKLPWIALSTISSAITVYVQSAGQAVRSLDHIPLTLRLENAAVSCARYFGQSVVPIQLIPFYPFPTEGYPAMLVASAAVLLLFVSALALATVRRHPCLFAGWFWFLGMLVPVIGLVQVGEQAMANRYMYLPQIGLSIAAIWLIPATAARTPRSTFLAWTAALSITVALAATTWHQLGYWRDSVTLFQRTVKVADSSEARTLLGYSFQLRQEWDKALPQYARAVELKPNQVIAINNIASIYLEQGRWADAEREANRAIAADPAHAAAYVNLGTALEGRNRLEEAVTQYAQAARIQPNFAKAYEKLGAALIVLGRYDEAVNAFGSATQHTPGKADNWTNLGIALAGARRFRESEPFFQHALTLDPDNVAARCNYAHMLYLSGAPERAEAELEQVLAKHPDNPDALALLAEMHAARTAPASTP